VVAFFAGLVPAYRSGERDGLLAAADAFGDQLKADRGLLRPEQAMWLHALDAAGQTAVVWRPADLDCVLNLLTRRASRLEEAAG